MKDDTTSNVAKGRTSYDANIGTGLVAFFNRNITPYATEVGGPRFDLVPVTKQKDLMLNAARMYARQEYERIMELVAVLQKQAEQLRHRLDITDLVHAAHYEFQIYPGQFYWLVWDHGRNRSTLQHMGPRDWSTGAPTEFEYLCRIKWLGDNTWIEVDDNGEPVA